MKYSLYLDLISEMGSDFPITKENCELFQRLGVDAYTQKKASKNMYIRQGGDHTYFQCEKDKNGLHNIFFRHTLSGKELDYSQERNFGFLVIPNGIYIVNGTAINFYDKESIDYIKKTAKYSDSELHSEYPYIENGIEPTKSINIEQKDKMLDSLLKLANYMELEMEEKNGRTR